MSAEVQLEMILVSEDSISEREIEPRINVVRLLGPGGRGSVVICQWKMTCFSFTHFVSSSCDRARVIRRWGSILSRTFRELAVDSIKFMVGNC